MQIVCACYQAVARTKDINSPAHLKFIPSFQIQESIKDWSQFDAEMGVGVENWELPRTFWEFLLSLTLAMQWLSKQISLFHLET